MKKPDCPACGVNELVMFSSEDMACCAFCGSFVEMDRATTAKYDAEYVAQRYDRYPTTEEMSKLRTRILEAVIDLHETLPLWKEIRRGRLLDVGYGNGSFIRYARHRGWDAFGYDVNPTEYEGVRRVEFPADRVLPPEERYRVITFFDALEHFEELSWAKCLALNTDWLMISVPCAPDGFPGQVKWKHRRLGEHHFHFKHPDTFEVLFSSGRTRAKVVYCDYPEDVIRGKLPNGEHNIMTCLLRCLDVSEV